MRTLVSTAAILVALGLGTTMAVAGDKANDNRSDQGNYHAADASQYGNYGFLGEVGGTPGYHNGATGQEPTATGYNNSHSPYKPNGN